MTIQTGTCIGEFYRYPKGRPAEVFITPSNGIGTWTSTLSRSGTSNRLWKQQVRHGLNATTNYSVESIREAPSEGQFTAQGTQTDPYDPTPGARCRWFFRGSGKGPYNSGGGPSTPPSQLSTADLDTAARIAFLNKVRDERTSFQGGVFLGELKEAIHMVVRPGQALRRAVSTYSSVAKKAARRERNLKMRIKAISGTWLEQSYGWRPLFSDVDSAMLALAKVGHYIPRQVLSVQRADVRSARAIASGTMGGSINYSQPWRWRRKASVRYKGAVAWESQNLAPNWRSNWGFELREFVPTMYELIPYSFLVDYFTNLGEIINASSVGVVGLRWGCKTTWLQADVDIVGQPSYSSATPDQKIETFTWQFSAGENSRFNLNREIVTSVGVGISDLTFRCPGVSSTKWLNIAALAVEKLL